MNFKAHQLILHFGLAKTGTSALQQAFFDQREELLKNHDTLYPGKHKNHFFFQAMFAQQPEKLYQIQTLKLKDGETVSGFLAKYRQSVLDEINEVKPRQIIISSEYFSGMSTDELKAFRSFLESIAEDIILFAYVRDPWSFSISYIQEMIRAGYIKKEATFGYVQSNVEIIAKFEYAFGKRATILPYEQGPDGYNVVKTFCEKFGFSSLVTDINMYQEVNSSMRSEAACLMLQLNQLYPVFDEHNNFIPDPARDWMAEAIQNSPLSKTSILISDRTAKKIYEKSRADIEFLEEQYFSGKKSLSMQYNSVQTTELDALSISRFQLEQLSDYLLSCMRELSERALNYYEHAERLNAELTEIKSSKGWKIIWFFRQINILLGPDKTRRDRVVQQLINMISAKFQKIKRRTREG